MGYGQNLIFANKIHEIWIFFLVLFADVVGIIYSLCFTCCSASRGEIYVTVTENVFVLATKIDELIAECIITSSEMRSYIRQI